MTEEEPTAVVVVDINALVDGLAVTRTGELMHVGQHVIARDPAEGQQWPAAVERLTISGRRLVRIDFDHPI